MAKGNVLFFYFATRTNKKTTTFAIKLPLLRKGPKITYINKANNRVAIICIY